MNSKWAGLILIVVCIVSGATIQYTALLPHEVVEQPKSQTTNNNISQATLYAPINLASPTPNSTVVSPLTLTGSAPGNWYFEANMPVDVLDAQMNAIGSGYVTAQGDWMTTLQVPFSGVVSFNSLPNTTGYIRFKKDNPSGEPQNDASVVIPISF